MQAYDAVEYFAGTAWVTKAFRLGGHPTAALDLTYEPDIPGRMNPMDLTTTAGMAFFGLHDQLLAILSCKGVLVDCLHQC